MRRRSNLSLLLCFYILPRFGRGLLRPIQPGLATTNFPRSAIPHSEFRILHSSLHPHLGN